MHRASPVYRLVQPKNRLGQGTGTEPKISFGSVSPKKRGFGFGFKTDPGLVVTTVCWYRAGGCCCGIFSDGPLSITVGIISVLDRRSGGMDPILFAVPD